MFTECRTKLCFQLLPSCWWVLFVCLFCVVVGFLFCRFIFLLFFGLATWYKVQKFISKWSFDTLLLSAIVLAIKRSERKKINKNKKTSHAICSSLLVIFNELKCLVLKLDLNWKQWQCSCSATELTEALCVLFHAWSEIKI